MSLSIECAPSRDTIPFSIGQEYKESREESFGEQARKLWEKTFQETAEIAKDSEILFTGIGGAPFLNKLPCVREYPDSSHIPYFVDLKQTLRRVPRVLFLIASPLLTDDLVGLKGVSREYKKQGVEKIIALITAMPHERQDHRFYDQFGKSILQPTLLKDTVSILSQSVDGGIIVQPHSLRSVELAIQKGFPLLPLDAFPLLLGKAKEVVTREKLFVIGPDKGRKDQAKRAAVVLECPIGFAIKNRDRLGVGTPTITIPFEILEEIQRGEYTVAIFDDEIREGNTMDKLAHALKEYANGMVVFAIKPICAGNGNGKTAVDHLINPFIKKICVTDAVKPRTDLKPLEGKLDIIPIGPELVKIAQYFTEHLVEPDNDNWLDPRKTGTSLCLDLSIEAIG